MPGPTGDAARADQLLVVLSDIEMGAGGATDDFPHTPWLADLILQYCRPPWSNLPVDLVLNGDTFDFLKTAVNGGYSHLVDAEIGLAKLRRVMAAHPAFFAGLHQFLGWRGAPRRVVFTVGNHDFELLFPEVQAAIRAALGGTEANVLFPGFEVDIGDVHVEHGSQADPLFRIDPAAAFLEWNGRKILNLPWAAVALTDVAMPLHPVLYPCDRSRPHGRVLALLPEVRALLLDRYWQYWTRDWLGAWWSASDPVKHVSWTLFRQVAARLQSGDPSITLDPRREGGLAREDRALVLLGHLHEAGWSTSGVTKLLRTGCMRDEFRVATDGAVGRPLPKVYAEVLMRGGKTFRSHLVEVDGPEGAHAAMPASILEVLAGIGALGKGGGDSVSDQEAQISRESIGPMPSPVLPRQ